ncbi:MAG: MXAN_2562 family outer membrane beta-barrel protein [Deltaproteobacteria bacterium]|nr:MXAN_2562 family outer membrane beta-barrel protein [Deltaproteobacteria bacterium]
MRRLAYICVFLSVVGLGSPTDMAKAATEGAEALVEEDFTFTFDKETAAGGYTALGNSDAVLNTHLNQSRCLCEEKFRINVVLSSAGQAKLGNDTVVGQVMVGAGCEKEGSKCSNVAGEFKFTRTAGTLTAETDAKKLFTAVAGTKQACSEVEGTFTFWLKLLKDGNTLSAMPSKSLDFDSKPPEQPSIKTVTPSNGAARVEWNAGASGSLAYYQVLCSPNPADTYSPAFTYCPADASQALYKDLKFCSERVSSSAADHRVLNLENEKLYALSLVAIDKSGNVSPVSADVRVTPAPSTSFHDLYKENAGQAEGGCQIGARGGAPSVGALWFAMMGLFAVFRPLRRHRTKAALLLLALAYGWSPTNALADTLGIIDPAPAHERDKLATSERGYNLNLGVGFYRPDVDSEFGGDGPFTKIFGKDDHPLWQLRLERLLWQKIGTLSVGLGVGYYGVYGKALTKDGGKSADETSLQVVPVTVDLGYQYDMWVRRGWGLMPFARAGLDRAFWFMRDEDSIDDKGGTNGWHAAIGLAFALDALDPESAQQLDSETGVNHTLVYVEYLVQDLSGLGSRRRLQLSDSMLSLGISLQM